MAESTKRGADLVDGFRSFTLQWGLPILAMFGAIFLSHPSKTLIWIAALIWMGLACLINARRCGRTHCYYTGPFFSSDDHSHLFTWIRNRPAWSCGLELVRLLHWDRCCRYLVPVRKAFGEIPWINHLPSISWLHGIVSHRIKQRKAGSFPNSKDWVTSNKAYMLAWGLPHAAVIAAIWLDPPLRAAVWSLAAAWMGGACLANARRCGRVHCRFTGPYYLALIVPVALLGFGILPGNAYLWWAFGAAILMGGKIIWFVTESRWGRYGTGQT